MRSFETVTVIAAPPPVVFEVALDVGVHTASMAESGEQAVGGVTSGQLRLGDTVTWRARHLAVWWRMTSVISAWEPPRWFVDEQVEGPFARWHHLHRFEPDPSGGTVMRDIIEFAAPLGPLGTVAEVTVLGWYLPRLIEARNDHVRRVAEAMS